MEKRREERIPVESLPDCLKNVIVSTGMFQEYPAVTVDASNNGMGFIVEDINNNAVVAGDNIVIKVMPYNYKLKSKVSYVKVIDENKLKFGIHFENVKPLDKYQEILTLDIYK